MAGLLDINNGRIVSVAIFYKVSALLGTGRFAEVYKAFDTRTHTDVALKIYTGTDPETHGIAKNEESNLGRLANLNSEYFPKLRRSLKERIQNLNHPLLIMELGAYVAAEGEKRVVCLKDVIPGPCRPQDCVVPDTSFWEAEALIQWIIHLAQAVKQLHSVGIIHRDLKPANILLKRGAGQSSSVPFLLDFNTSVFSGGSGSLRGTPRYLPPEVRAGRRTEPACADDLWAMALIVWEMIYGLDTPQDSACSPHALVSGKIPDGVRDTLKRALAIEPQERFETAAEFLDALEESVRSIIDTDVLSSDQFSCARSAMERIRNAILQSLAPPGDIVVPKDIEDTVTTAIALLAETETQSLDLVAEFVRLGPLAMPVCLQQGYRLPGQKEAYNDILQALTQLASSSPDIAQRSINKFVLSSNRGVRALCLDLCENIKYFPEVLLKSLRNDEGLLISEERLRVASLCIRFSQKRTAVLALEKYMFREFILDRDRYYLLRDTVARKMHELRIDESKPGGSETMVALLIAQDTSSCEWRELEEFVALSDVEARATEKGLVELMADAYAATGHSGLRTLQGGKVPRTAGPNKVPVFRRFAAKLAQTYPPTKSWLLGELQRTPDDRDLKMALGMNADPEHARDAADQLIEEYLESGDGNLFNKLRFWKSDAVLRHLSGNLSQGASSRKLQLILELLSGYDNRLRPDVVKVVVDNWKVLTSYDFEKTVTVLTSFSGSVPNALRKRAIDLLNTELGGLHEPAARKGLERLLR